MYLRFYSWTGTCSFSSFTLQIWVIIHNISSFKFNDIQLLGSMCNNFQDSYIIIGEVTMIQIIGMKLHFTFWLEVNLGWHSPNRLFGKCCHDLENTVFKDKAIEDDRYKMSACKVSCFNYLGYLGHFQIISSVDFNFSPHFLTASCLQDHSDIPDKYGEINGSMVIINLTVICICSNNSNRF
jgi:hypothetical protein